MQLKNMAYYKHSTWRVREESQQSRQSISCWKEYIQRVEGHPLRITLRVWRGLSRCMKSLIQVNYINEPQRKQASLLEQNTRGGNLGFCS